MAELIQRTDDLNTGREKLNNAIVNADEAKQKSNQAVGVSEQAKQIAQTAENKADNVQEQFNQVVIEGDSSVEAAQARVDEKGVSHPTLKARIDDGFERTAAQLAHTTEEVERIENSLRLKSDLTIFIDSINGSDDNDGSEEQPVKTWSKVVSMIPLYNDGRDVRIRIKGNLSEPIVLEGLTCSSGDRGGRRIQVIGDTENKNNHTVPYFHIDSCTGGFQHSFELWHITFVGNIRNEIQGTSGFNIEFCNIHNTDIQGIYIKGSHGRVRHCDFQNNNQGVTAGYYSQVHLQDNTGIVGNRTASSNRSSIISIRGTQPVRQDTGKIAIAPNAEGLILPYQAIEEIGHENDWYWVKYGDGTMIMQTAISHDATSTEPTVVQYPKENMFMLQSRYPITLSISGSNLKGDFSNILSEVEALSKTHGRARQSDFSVRTYEPVQGVNNLGLAVTIIGRWKEPITFLPPPPT